jgi:glycogen debranching enzyme
MQFLDDDMKIHLELKSKGETLTLKMNQIVYRIFEAHARGISFREWKAGMQLDSNMDTEGFQIDLCLNVKTGFIVGGNHRNCLTWMDKMGSSHKAGN